MIETEDGPYFRSVVKRCELRLSQSHCKFPLCWFLAENLIKKNIAKLQKSKTLLSPSFRYTSEIMNWKLRKLHIFTNEMQLSLIIAANRHKRVLWYRVIYRHIFPFPFLFHSLKHDGLIALLDDARNKRHPDFYLMSPNYTVFAVAAEHYKVADPLIYRLVRLSRSSRDTKVENSRTCNRNITTDNCNVSLPTERLCSICWTITRNARFVLVSRRFSVCIVSTTRSIITRRCRAEMSW